MKVFFLLFYILVCIVVYGEFVCGIDFRVWVIGMDVNVKWRLDLVLIFYYYELLLVRNLVYSEFLVFNCNIVYVILWKNKFFMIE